LSGVLLRPLAFGLGARQALDAGRGDRSVPVRSAVFAVGVGIAAFVLAATFNASLTKLLDDPDLYGWNWDVQLGSIGSPDVSEYMLAGLAQNEDIAAVSAGTLAQVQVEGARADAYALNDIGRGVDPLVLEGHSPRDEDEIVLGTTTLRELGAEIGDEVYVGVGGLAERMRIVGRAVFPSFGDQGQLGIGARLTLDGLRRLDEQPVRNVYLVRYEEGTDAEAVTRDLDRAVSPYLVSGPKPPEDLSNLADADRVPVMAGLTLALLAVATLAHALLTAARRRRREVGALRSMGFRQRQVLATFAGQAMVLAVGAVVVGVPLGVAVGRWAWIEVADEYGFPAEPVIPWLAIVALAVAVPLIALVVAVGPGWIAARARPAEILRAE
jgi:putative ABC transport system permease protein